MPQESVITGVGYEVRRPENGDGLCEIVFFEQVPLPDGSGRQLRTGTCWRFPLDQFAASDISGQLVGEAPKKRAQIVAPGLIRPG